MTTPFLDRVYTRVHFDRELVFKFFTIFSLFEYALKETGFRTETGKAEANWDKFAKNIRDNFDPNSSLELKKAVDYFLDRPPMKQIIEDNRVVFDAPKRKQERVNTKELSDHIRRVRNNLFHGGKVRYDRYRDTPLIQNSIIILESWAQLNKDVQQVLEHIE